MSRFECRRLRWGSSRARRQRKQLEVKNLFAAVLSHSSPPLPPHHISSPSSPTSHLNGIPALNRLSISSSPSLLPAPPPYRSRSPRPLPSQSSWATSPRSCRGPAAAAAASAAGFSQHHSAHARVLKSNTGLELRAEERGGRSGKDTKQLPGGGRGSTAHLAGGVPSVSGWAAAPGTRVLAGNSVGPFTTEPGWHQLVRADANLATPSKPPEPRKPEIRKKEKPRRRERAPGSPAPRAPRSPGAGGDPSHGSK